jgi:hypothetical protein
VEVEVAEEVAEEVAVEVAEEVVEEEDPGEPRPGGESLPPQRFGPVLEGGEE